jgi:hypothetical protein
MYIPQYDLYTGQFIGVNLNGVSIPKEGKNKDWIIFLEWYNLQNPKPFTFNPIPVPQPREQKSVEEIQTIYNGLTKEQKDTIITRLVIETLHNDPDLILRAGYNINLWNNL